jgi:hypothetical protein
VFPGAAKTLRWEFPDPSRLRGTDEEKLARVREIRELIRAEIQKFITREDLWVGAVDNRPHGMQKILHLVGLGQERILLQ